MPPGPKPPTRTVRCRGRGTAPAQWAGENKAWSKGPRAAASHNWKWQWMGAAGQRLTARLGQMGGRHSTAGTAQPPTARPGLLLGSLSTTPERNPQNRGPKMTRTGREAAFPWRPPGCRKLCNPPMLRPVHPGGLQYKSQSQLFQAPRAAAT